MKVLNSFFYYLAIILVIIAVFSDEVEGRRRILRGRKTLTRTYYRDLGIPGWSIILLTGIGMVIVGGIMYGVMKKLILDTIHSYSPPVMQNEV